MLSAVVCGVLCGSLTDSAGAWPRRKEDAPQPEATAKLDVTKLKGRLFPKELPLDFGATPDGLANPSAQGCAACHPQIALQWSAGAHAATPSPILLEAARGRPACLSCHLPLAAQHDTLFTYEGGRLDRPVPSPNPAFQATLSIEAVTCAACHLRDAAVVVGSPEAAAAQAPHRMVYSDLLPTSEACAACHQLSWPGADQPLYDTFGEWERSGFPALGIDCQDCHMLGGADGALGADHGMTLALGQAVSVLLDAPSLGLVRGGATIPARITLQNTGAGHAYPTGSPFRGIRLIAELVRVLPAEAQRGDPSTVEAMRIDLLSVDIARRVGAEPPFAVESDTRLQAGESRTYDLMLALPQEAPPGKWRLVVSLVQVVRNAPQKPAIVERSWPLVIE